MNQSPDVAIIGGGIIGLTTAIAAARRGLSVAVISDQRAGEASGAAAGALAPSIERAEGAAHDFAIASRDMYPAYIEDLAERTGIRVPLNRLGVLQVALTSGAVKGLRKTAPPTAQWIDRKELAEAEPTLGHALGAMLNPDDGAVDNVTMLRALSALIDTTPTITRIDQTARRVSTRETGSVRIQLSSGKPIDSAFAVIAGGAWSSTIEGLPLISAVSPARGQMVAYDSIGLRHVVFGPRGYLVPRVNIETIGGATMENVGFDASTTQEGIDRVRSTSEEIAPALSVMQIRRSWAGLRPVTEDLLPLLGPDPERPTIIYSCGHSRNGILLAPLSAEVVGDMLLGEQVKHDLSQFRPERFQGRF
ncbi:MAG TPA: FAD-dependent oxidoreductase [Gemmatimonadaceae bacterium]|nr:FAD-dependent oxidoreductase [Gemmatimonadaceae bacterium]